MLFIETATFAKSGEILQNSDIKLPAQVCQTSSATDANGTVVASGTCCRTYFTAPTGAALLAANVTLLACAEGQRDLALED
jgi:uridylate kinase